MKYRTIFWIFSFFFYTVFSNNTRQPEQVQTAGTGFNTLEIPASSLATGTFGKFPEGFSVTPGKRQTILLVESEETKEYRNITGTKSSRMPSAGFERLTLFTGYNKGANSTLLVVESWESSSLIDNSSYNPALKKLDGEKITGRSN